jgi:hypothetical protein
MSGILDNITGAVKSVGEGAFGAVKSVGEGAFGAVKSVGEGAYHAVGDVGEGAYHAVGDVGQGAYGAVANVGQGAYGAVSNVGQGVGKGLKKISPFGGRAGKMSKKMMKQMKKMNKSLQNKVKSAASYNLAASIGGRRHRHRGGYYNYAVTSNSPSGIYDAASPYPGEAYGTPLPLHNSDPMPTPAQHFRGGNTQTLQLPAGGLQMNVQDAAGNTTSSVGISLPSPVNMNVNTGGRRHKSRRHSRKGGKGRKGGKTQKGCSKKSYGGKRSRKSHKY